MPKFGGTVVWKLASDEATVVLRVDSTIHWMNDHPSDNTVGFRSSYPLDIGLSAALQFLVKSN